MNEAIGPIEKYSRHRSANKYLCALAFSESIFFPAPTDLMLAPMCVFRPNKAVYLAFLATVFSVLGGVAGYYIGNLAFHLLEPAWSDSGWWNHYLEARSLFDKWGGWATLIAALTPIPYKVFTVAAGATEQNLAIFIIASSVGRGIRFFVLALLSVYLGNKFLTRLRLLPNWPSWLIIAAAVIFFSLELGNLFVK